MKLNLGAGKYGLKGWLSVDISGEVDIRHDLNAFPWPFLTGGVKEIQASHILEHLTKAQARQFLTECYRLLAEGGSLHIAVPDMDIFVECRLADDWTAVNGYPWVDFNWFLGGDEREANPDMRHKYMYNVETLGTMLRAAGFFEFYTREMSNIDNPKFQAISLYMTAEK